jgi:ATP-dependent helicase/nuclease subunit A
MAEIYPGRRVDAAILWTRTATLMNLPHDMVMAALARTPTS